MTNFTRRNILELGAVGLSVPLIGQSSAWAQNAKPVNGGHAIVAMNAATETIDPHFSRSQAARNVLMHIYETLVTIDEQSSPQLQLAEKLDVSPDFRVYTFTLRKGVLFHNGKEMTAVDAMRSLERYSKVSPEKQRLATVSKMSTPDKYTLVVELQAPMPSWIELIKSPASPMTIIPSEECDKEPNKVSPIGTGPFEFMDWDGVTQLRIKRNNKYVPNESYEGRDGYCGKRTAYLDQVTFRVVTEGSARVAGLQSGEFHIVDEVPVPAAKRLQADSQFTIYDRMPLSINVVPVNVARSPTDNILVRRAIQQAINSEEIMAIATDGNYRLNPSFVYPGTEYYPRNADKLIYNAGDSDRAKALLKEANYKGEEIVILSSSDIASLKEVAVVMSEQLKAAGMKTRIDILDWPGANARRSDPTSHNLFSTAYAIQPLLGPFQYQRLMATPSNWSFYKEDQRFDEIWTKLLAATNVDERRTVWEQIEEHLNENVYQLKIGDRGIKQVATSKLKNFKPYDAIRMWDVWLA